VHQTRDSEQQLSLLIVCGEPMKRRKTDLGDQLEQQRQLSADDSQQQAAAAAGAEGAGKDNEQQQQQHPDEEHLQQRAAVAVAAAFAGADAAGEEGLAGGGCGLQVNAAELCYKVLTLAWLQVPHAQHALLVITPQPLRFGTAGCSCLSLQITLLCCAPGA
jgi:hypothetical protein